MRTTRVARAALLLLAAACSTAEEVAELGVGDACLIGSDCKSPMVCVFARCHQQCADTRDCPAGLRCVLGSKPQHVCQLADERACEYNSDCSAPQVCAVDGQCRDQCVTPQDCVPGQLCVSGTCADTSEVVDGRLPGEAVDSGEPCVWDSDCAGGMHCKKQQCVFDCLVDADCSGGSACIENRCVKADAGFECVAGQQPHCTCRDGATGVRVCGVDNKWGPCMCPASTGGAGGTGGASTSTAGGAGGPVGGAGGVPTTSSAGGSGGAINAGGGGTSGGVGGGGGTIGGAGGGLTSGGTGGAGTSGGTGGGLTSGGTGGGSTSGGTGGGLNVGGTGGAPTVGAGGFAGSAIDTGSVDASLDSMSEPDSVWFGAPAGELLISFASSGVVGGRAVVDDLGGATLVGNASDGVALAGEPLVSDGDDVVIARLEGADASRAVSYPARGVQEVSALAADRSGAIAVAGVQAFYAALDFGAPRSPQRRNEPLEGTDGFVAVLGPDGRPTWQASLEGEGLVAPSAIAIDARGVVVAGELSGTLRVGRHVARAGTGSAAFVARFDPDGQLAWMRTFGGRGAVALHALALDARGGAVLIGSLTGSVNVDGLSLQSAGRRDVLLLHLDAGGRLADGARFGDDADQQGRAIAVRADGGLLAAGEMSGMLDLGGGPLESAGGSDAFVAAFDARGTHQWSRRLGGAGSDAAVAVTEDGAGEVVLAGDYASSWIHGGTVMGCAGQSDAFVTKLDAQGQVIWLRGFGNGHAQHTTSLAVAPSDAVVLGITSAGGALDVGAGPELGDSYVLVLAP